MTNWSKFQNAIFTEVTSGSGHVVVEALAGSGKSTTIEEAFSLVPSNQSVMVVAFNKKIAEAMQARVAKRGLTNVTASTLHSFGFSALRWKLRGVRINNYRVKDMVVSLYKISFDDKEALKNTADSREMCEKLISLAKAHLVESREEMDALIDAYGLDVNGERERILSVAREALRICRDVKRCLAEGIDFDDMIWLPVVLGLTVKQYDVVFVDETQDLNVAQVELALRACRKSGRIIAVGDRFQSIYGFRGADKDAMPRLIDRLDAKVLPLSVTYRCAKSIVREAQRFVPSIEAPESAVEGSSLVSTHETMDKNVRAGDFVLSRSNAPLVALCLRWLGEGRKVKIQGRDIGTQLVRLIGKSKATTIPALIEWIAAWKNREIERLVAKKADEQSVQLIEDKAECIGAMCVDMENVAAVINRCNNIFSDMTDENAVVLSSTHKAKGLERDRVWLLADTYLKRGNAEERNLAYVAITRAKRELHFVSDTGDDAIITYR